MLVWSRLTSRDVKHDLASTFFLVKSKRLSQETASYRMRGRSICFGPGQMKSQSNNFLTIGPMGLITAP